MESEDGDSEDEESQGGERLGVSPSACDHDSEGRLQTLAVLRMTQTTVCLSVVAADGRDGWVHPIIGTGTHGVA
jgi:hypothetical protein